VLLHGGERDARQLDGYVEGGGEAGGGDVGVVRLATALFGEPAQAGAAQLPYRERDDNAGREHERHGRGGKVPGSEQHTKM
jgi:hypothetical protein